MARLLGWSKTERYDDFEDVLNFELDENDFPIPKTERYSRSELREIERLADDDYLRSRSHFRRSRSVISSPRTIERYSLAKIRERLAGAPLEATASTGDTMDSWEHHNYW